MLIPYFKYVLVLHNKYDPADALESDTHPGFPLFISAFVKVDVLILKYEVTGLYSYVRGQFCMGCL